MYPFPRGEASLVSVFFPQFAILALCYSLPGIPRVPLRARRTCVRDFAASLVIFFPHTCIPCWQFYHFHFPFSIFTAFHMCACARSLTPRPPVYPDGTVCISILHTPGDDPTMYEQASERWSPVQSVEKVILSVISMLAGAFFSLSLRFSQLALLVFLLIL
jgi:hypothetical protein